MVQTHKQKNRKSKTTVYKLDNRAQRQELSKYKDTNIHAHDDLSQTMHISILLNSYSLVCHPPLVFSGQ